MFDRPRYADNGAIVVFKVSVGRWPHLRARCRCWRRYRPSQWSKPCLYIYTWLDTMSTNDSCGASLLSALSWHNKGRTKVQNAAVF